jgi:hypothetical protein
MFVAKNVGLKSVRPSTLPRELASVRFESIFKASEGVNEETYEAKTVTKFIGVDKFNRQRTSKVRESGTALHCKSNAGKTGGAVGTMKETLTLAFKWR